MSIEAKILLAEYDRAWTVLGSGTAVCEVLELTPDEHFELAAWRRPGAERVVVRREAAERRNTR